MSSVSALDGPVLKRVRADTLALSTREGRVPGTAGHEAAHRFLRDRFAEIGLVPRAPSGDFDHSYLASDGIRMTNLMGVVPGQDRSIRPILLGAHYDSVIPAPCAGDNAAGVAVMLAVAELVAHAPLDRDLLVVAFDAEEPPYFLGPDMGSYRLVAEVLGDPVHLAIVLDLIGHPVRVTGLPLNPDLMFVTGAESHPALPGVLAGLDSPLAAAAFRRVGDYSDYAAFREAGAPYLFFSCGEWADYHQPSDLPAKLDFSKMARLVGDLERVIRRSDAVVTEYHSTFDATDFEVQTLEASIGPEILTPAARMLGRTGYRTAEDMDAIIGGLRSRVRGW